MVVLLFYRAYVVLKYYGKLYKLPHIVEVSPRYPSVDKCVYLKEMHLHNKAGEKYSQDGTLTLLTTIVGLS